MKFGITSKSMELLITALKRQTAIEGAAIFGSRSIGNYKNGSDIDIALYGEQITEQIVRDFYTELNERLPLPYFFDVVHYDRLEHDGLKEHIDRFGTQFYARAQVSLPDEVSSGRGAER
ncbi:nucleotidyltransferase domain-containing protein [Heliophilum fasciatum]|nr:nucleotidyltransferase domain-containing protein [Heliophilum fasciatum]MCW2279140.1 putative nucleotidyltransferase [Heliophilum fasciatum]